MTTTDTTTTPVPTWLNLDDIVPADLRIDIAGLRDRTRAMNASMLELVREAGDAIARAEQAISEAVNQLPDDLGITALDGITDAIAGLVGSSPLHNELLDAITTMGEIVENYGTTGVPATVA